MGEVVQLGPRARRQKHGSTDLDLSSKRKILSGESLRNLIDSWIVPKLVDEWMNQPAKPGSDSNEDNGEQS
jgi:hypothetical protein